MFKFGVKPEVSRLHITIQLAKLTSNWIVVSFNTVKIKWSEITVIILVDWGIIWKNGQYTSDNVLHFQQLYQVILQANAWGPKFKIFLFFLSYFKRFIMFCNVYICILTYNNYHVTNVFFHYLSIVQLHIIIEVNIFLNVTEWWSIFTRS